MMDGEINVQDIRNVDVDDLLGRDPINVDVESILCCLVNRTARRSRFASRADIPGHGKCWFSPDNTLSSHGCLFR